MKQYSIGTIETVGYFNSTVDGTLLHYLINLVVNNHDKDPGQSLINDNYTMVSIVEYL